MSVAATVGDAVVSVDEVDASEARLRATLHASALPRPHTSEGRQLRRWLVQVLTTARVVAAEAHALGVTDERAPDEAELLPDVAARLEIGSVGASVLEEPLGRALFVHLTADMEVSADDVVDYHRRNPLRFARRPAGDGAWLGPPVARPLAEVRADIAAHLLASARRREFRRWLDVRRAELVALAPGYEHPGDPGQPDNTHKH